MAIIGPVDAVLPAMTLTGTLRPLNPLRDLLAVADLIELCFHGTMDAEGRTFLHDLRRSSRGSSLLGRTISATQWAETIRPPKSACQNELTSATVE